MTPDEIIFHRRTRVLAHAIEIGNVAEACRRFGISRTTFYRWRRRADRYGIDALMPKARRRPQMPNATPTWIVDQLLVEAVLRPTLGCRQLADALAERGLVVSKSTAQDILVRHDLGTRAKRVGALATLTALRTGVVTPAADPTGFCQWAAGPAELVGIDSFSIGNLKGVGPVYQFTAVDVATRWAWVQLIAGRPNAARAAGFVTRLCAVWDTAGFPLTAVVSDNGPEFAGAAFTSRLADLNVAHRRIPPRSPNHNAVCERFQGTMLQECWRPAFHKRRFTSVGQLQAEADAWLISYNTRRPNHSDYMRGRTPLEILDSHTTHQPT